jgi:hypothetical protein
VARRQGHDQTTSTVEKRIGAYKQCAGPCPHNIREGRFDLNIAAGVEDHHFLADCARRRFRFLDIRHSRRKIRVRKHCDGRGRGNEIVQDAQTLLDQFRGKDVDSSRIAAGSGEAIDKAQLNRIGADVEYDGNCCGRRLGRSGRSFAADRHDDGYLTANEIGR